MKYIEGFWIEIYLKDYKFILLDTLFIYDLSDLFETINLMEYEDGAYNIFIRKMSI